MAGGIYNLAFTLCQAFFLSFFHIFFVFFIFFSFFVHHSSPLLLLFLFLNSCVDWGVCDIMGFYSGGEY